MERPPLSFIVSKCIFVCLTPKLTGRAAAFNGVGVPGDELPQDERIRLQFVSLYVSLAVEFVPTLFRDHG